MRERKKEEKRKEEKAAWQLERYNHAIKRSRKGVIVRGFSRETNTYLIIEIRLYQ